MLVIVERLLKLCRPLALIIHSYVFTNIMTVSTRKNLHKHQAKHFVVEALHYRTSTTNRAPKTLIKSFKTEIK